MKVLFSLLLLMTFSTLRAQEEEKRISCSYVEVSFKEFCNDIKLRTGYRIFYRDSLVENIRITLTLNEVAVSEAVNLALAGSDYKAYSWHKDIVITSGLKLITNLPAYSMQVDKTDYHASEKVLLTESEERYLTGRTPGSDKIITVGNPGRRTRTKAKVLGRILDEETGEPMNYVTVYIPEMKTGTLSDLNGFFTLMLMPGKYNVSVEFMGYEKEKFILDLHSEGNLIVRMKSSAIQLQEVVVTTERQANIRAKEPGLDQISIKTLKTLPMMMGERDPVKISSTLPGIVSTGEGRQGINVRGGGSDQNAFYLNKIQVYNTAHLFGFFPAFNSDIIKDFSIYKGHIPAQYGGRLASVFNITTIRGNNKRISARSSINPISGNISVDGPIKKDTSSFVLSARSLYSNWILSRIRDTLINSSKANFYDISGGINWDIQKTRISLFGYHSYDNFRLADQNSYNYSNNGVSLITGYNFSNSLRGELDLVLSDYSFSTTDEQQKTSAYKHSYRLKQYEISGIINQTINEKNTLDYGAGVVLYTLDRGNVNPFGEESLRSEIDLGNDRGIESSLFISDSYEVLPWMNLTLGFRYTLYSPTGPVSVYKYSSGAPHDIRYIEDTVNFNSGKPVKWYHEPDLRAAINIETDRNGSIKLAFNQMHQNIFMLNTTTTIGPNTQWKLADYHIYPPKSSQISFGVFRTLPGFSLETSAELFYKRTSNYPEFRDGADFLNNPIVETSVLQGDQKAYGMELYLKRSMRKLEGWISYTYSRSYIKVDGEYSWNKINNGETYPSNFDIPHSLNLVLNYYLVRRVVFSSIFTYQTGKPITYPESVFFMNGSPYLDYSKRNAYRIPDYIRSDFSLTIEGNLKKKKVIHSSLSLNVYNATGRKNPYSVYFKTENGIIRSYMYSVIGVPVFTLTWSGKIGNYETE